MATEATDAKWLHLQRFLAEVSFDQESRASLSTYDSDSSGSSDGGSGLHGGHDSRYHPHRAPSPDRIHDNSPTRAPLDQRPGPGPKGATPARSHIGRPSPGPPSGHDVHRHTGRRRRQASVGSTPHRNVNEIHKFNTKDHMYEHEPPRYNSQFQHHNDHVVRSTNNGPTLSEDYDQNLQTVQRNSVRTTSCQHIPCQNMTNARPNTQPTAKHSQRHQHGDNLDEELAKEKDLFTRAVSRQSQYPDHAGGATHGRCTDAGSVTWVRMSPTLELEEDVDADCTGDIGVDTYGADDTDSEDYQSYTNRSMSNYGEIDDLTHLVGPLTENSIVTCLQARCAARAFQTQIGRVLLCVNDHGHDPPPRALTTPTGPRDRLATMVREAIDSHRETGRSQVIIVSGANGSGKSHCAQRLLQHVFGVGGGGPETDAFKHLQAALTVLQSLGTSATIANPHSSRLGYFFENSISDSAIYCTKIHCYFVDRERLMHATPTERNFHVFHDMLASLGPEERMKLHLAGHTAHSLRYLSPGLPAQGEPGDRHRFDAWKASLSVLGIQLSDMMRVLSAVLLLGNVKFVGTVGPELDVVGNNELKAVAALLGVSGMAFYRGFTTKTCRIRGQICKSIPDANMANRTRDCLAMGLYCRTLLAVIRRANSLRRPSSTHSYDSLDSAHETDAYPGISRQYSMSTSSHSLCGASHPANFIGVLDMFGFEVSETNRLEQLCINLCAEVMQHFYNSHVFRRAHDTLRDEGMHFEEVPYIDNGPVLQLLSSQKFGIFSVIETSSVSSIKESLISQLKSRHKVNDYFFEPHPKDDASFGVRHFAGRVVYDSSAFVSVNVDELCEDIVSVFAKQTCNFGFVSHLFAKELKSGAGLNRNGTGAKYRIMPYSLTHDYSRQDETPGSLCGDFQMKLDKLLKLLRHTNPHFVRCIKTNDTCEQGTIDKEVLLRQLRSLQVLETVQIMAGGIAHKMRFGAFRQRYRLFLKAPEDRKIPALETCKMILDEFLAAMDTSRLPYVSTQWSLGRRYIFYSEGTRQQLEAVRTERLHVLATGIQAAWRGHTCRRGWPSRRQGLLAEQQQRIMQAIHQIRDQRETPVAEISTPLQQNANLLHRVAELYNLNLDQPPAVPASRRYTIQGEVKVAFPQARRLQRDITETSTEGGETRIDKGAIVTVLGPSPQRGQLMVEGQTTTLHVPCTYMDSTYVPPFHCSQRPLTV